MTQYEYKLIELEMPGDLTAAIAKTFYGTPLSTEDRRSINVFVEKELNELGKKGWLLHNSSGLITLPTLLVYRTKGAKNVR